MSGQGCLLAGAAVVTAVSLAGCKAENCTIESSALSMVARVVDNGVTVRAEVDFVSGDRAEAAVPWKRCEGDRVEINGETAMEAVKEERVEYSLTLDGGAATAFEFVLRRELDDAPIIATVELPPAFDVIAPQPGQMIPRTDDVMLEWTPPNPGNELQLELAEEIGEGICIETDTDEHNYKRPGGVRVEDDGTWLVPASAIAGDPTAQCDARYILNRFSQGEYPAALASGGFVEAQVVRNVVFTSTP